MKKIILYTDGACSGNPGPGGWGAILDYNGHLKEMSGFNNNTTNNQMEMQAVIEGLKALKESCEVHIYSDSAYVVNAFLNDWIGYWSTHNWKTSSKKEVKNIEMWQELLALINKHKVFWYKVKGHSDNERNNRCDFLATNEIEKAKKEN